MSRLISIYFVSISLLMKLGWYSFIVLVDRFRLWDMCLSDTLWPRCPGLNQLAQRQSFLFSSQNFIESLCRCPRMSIDRLYGTVLFFVPMTLLFSHHSNLALCPCGADRSLIRMARLAALNAFFIGSFLLGARNHVLPLSGIKVFRN